MTKKHDNETAGPCCAPVSLLGGALDLTDELRWILGRPCFAVRGIAQVLRKSGYKCERKAEDEQAVAIHWMLLKYLEHGENWRKEGDKELDEMRAVRAEPEAA